MKRLLCRWFGHDFNIRPLRMSLTCLRCGLHVTEMAR